MAEAVINNILFTAVAPTTELLEERCIKLK